MDSNPTKLLETATQDLEDDKLDQLARPAFLHKPRVESNFHMVNADSFCVLPDFGSCQCYFFAIYDGHGSSGLEASQAANDYIMTFIECNVSRMNELSSSKETKQFVQEAFDQAEERMKMSGIDYSCCGTCCVAAFIRKSQLYIANVGNSQAILSTKTLEGRKVAVLSRRHTLELPEERERATKAEAEIRKEEVDGVPVGPDRIWLPYVKERKFGMTTTRALGHFRNKKYGISSEIDWKVVNLTNEDEFIVLGSDGLWDVMSSEEVAEYVANHEEKGVAKNLVDYAKKKWEERAEKGKVIIGDMVNHKEKSDDITAIIVYLKFTEA